MQREETWSGNGFDVRREVAHDGSERMAWYETASGALLVACQFFPTVGETAEKRGVLYAVSRFIDVPSIPVAGTTVIMKSGFGVRVVTTPSDHPGEAQASRSDASEQGADPPMCGLMVTIMRPPEPEDELITRDDRIRSYGLPVKLAEFLVRADRSRMASAALKSSYVSMILRQ